MQVTSFCCLFYALNELWNANSVPNRGLNCVHVFAKRTVMALGVLCCQQLLESHHLRHQILITTGTWEGSSAS